MLKKLSPIGSTHRQKNHYGGLAILMALFIIGCGGGGSGTVDGGTDTANPKTLKVSPDQVVPGTFITIEDNSISSDAVLEVTFSDPSGFEVVLETEITEEGIAKIAVPPLIDVDTGNLKAGTLTVALSNGNQATLTVKALPPLTDLEAGYVVKAYLQQARDNLNTALSHTTTFALENSYDVSELDMQIQGQIDSLTHSLNELEMWGTLTFYSYASGELVLDADDLKKVDQLLFAMLYGIHEEVGSTALRFAATASQRSVTALPQVTQDLIDSLVRTGDIQKTIKNGQTILVGSTAMLVTVAQYAIGPGAFGLSLGYTALSGGVGILVIGPASEGLSAIQAQDSGEAYRFGRHISEQFQSVLLNSLVALGGELNQIINLMSYFNSANDVRNALSDIICNRKLVDSKYVAFCTEMKRQRLLNDQSHVPDIRFFPQMMPNGSVGHLSFCISGNGASVNEIDIDWDDNKTVSYKWGWGQERGLTYGFDRIAHTYYLSDYQDREFAIKVKVTGDNFPEQEATTSTKVLVKGELDPLDITLIAQPKVLAVDEKGDWTFTVSGGMGPYQAMVNWDDGVTQQATSLFGDFKGGHTFKRGNVYDITLTITDSNKASVTETFPIQVGDTQPADATGSMSGYFDVTCADGNSDGSSFSVTIDQNGIVTGSYDWGGISGGVKNGFLSVKLDGFWSDCTMGGYLTGFGDSLSGDGTVVCTGGDCYGTWKAAHGGLN